MGEKIRMSQNLKLLRVLHEPRVAWKMMPAWKKDDPWRNHKETRTISSDSQMWTSNQLNHEPVDLKLNQLLSKLTFQTDNSYIVCKPVPTKASQWKQGGGRDWNHRVCTCYHEEYNGFIGVSGLIDPSKFCPKVCCSLSVILWVTCDIPLGHMTLVWIGGWEHHLKAGTVHMFTQILRILHSTTFHLLIG